VDFRLEPAGAALALGLLAGACLAPREAPPAAPPAPATEPGLPAPAITPAPPPVAAASLPALLLDREPAGTLGTSHPLVLEAVSSIGTWAVVCQARADTDGDGRVAVSVGPHGALAGDRMQRYLLSSDGTEQEIEALAARDPTGHWIVVLRGGRLILRDTRAGTELDLSSRGADERFDGLGYREHRSLSFDATGTRLAYLRRAGDGTEVAVRVLPSGEESVVQVGSGNVWRVELAPSGAWVIAHTIVDDTNGNGRLEWPAPEAEPAPCQGPIARYPAWLHRGDRPVALLAPSAGGPAARVDGWVAALGQRLVVRDANGRLLLERAGRTVGELADATCGGRVLPADPARSLLLVACAKTTGRAPVRLVGPGYTNDLGFSVASPGVDHPSRTAPRLVDLYAGSQAVLVDMQRKEKVELRVGDDVVVTSGKWALVRRGSELLAHDTETGAEERIASPVDAVADIVTNGAVAVVTPFVVDLARRRLIGRAPGRPLAVSRSGRVLVARGAPPSGDSVAVGPLEWLAPVAE
jgi:hypothetical protein